MGGEQDGADGLSLKDEHTFTFIHLADAFIQSETHSPRGTKYSKCVCAPSYKPGGQVTQTDIFQNVTTQQTNVPLRLN